MLEATDISVHLGRTAILHGISFRATAGQITAIAGPNGSGKTTLLRALTGEVPAKGQIRLNGRDVSRIAPAELASIRAVLPQKTALAFPFTALEVVRIGQSFGITPDPSLPRRALDRVGLLHLADRPYQLLSGGEQSRVQLARILAQVWDATHEGQPRWLFLDEPVASLDIGHQVLVMQIARDFADAGGGVVAVMHDLNLTAMFAQSVILMSDGRVLSHDGPAKVMTAANLSLAYGCQVEVGVVPQDRLFVLPQGIRAVAA